MDATCNVQDSIHVFHLVHNMCPGFWVHIRTAEDFYVNFHCNKCDDFQVDNPTTHPPLQRYSLVI